VTAILTLAALIIWLRCRHRPAPDESQDPGQRRVPADVPAQHHTEPAESAPWSALYERRLRLPSGHPVLRVVVVGVVVLIVIAGIFLTGDYLPSVTVLSAARVATVSRAVLALGLVLAAGAWTLVLAGVFFARWQVRLCGLGVIGSGAAAEWHVMGSRFSLFGGAAGFAAIGGIFVMGALTVAADLWPRPDEERGIDTRSQPWASVITAAIGVLVVIVYANQAVRLGGLGSVTQASASVIDLLYATTVVIVPMLLIAGADVADFGWEVANAASLTLGKRPQAQADPPGRVALLAFLAGIAALAIAGHSLGVRVLVSAVLAGAAFAAAVVVTAATPAGRYRRWDKLPALICAAIVFWALIGFQVVTGLQKVLPSSALSVVRLDRVFVPRDQPVFRFRYPGACHPADNSLPGFTIVYIASCQPVRGLAAGLSFTFSYTVMSSPVRFPDPCSDLKSELMPSGVAGHYVRGRSNGAWRTCGFSGGRERGIAWTRLTGDRTWLLYGQSSGSIYPFAEPLLQGMRDSWRNTAAPGPATGGDALGTTRYLAGAARNLSFRADLLWLAIAAAGALVVVYRRRQGSRLSPAALYVIITGVWIAAGFIAGRAGFNEQDGYSLPIGGALALAGVGTLCYTARFAVRGWRSGHEEQQGGRSERGPATDGRLASLLVLDISLLLIWGAEELYGTASRVEATQVKLGALVIVLALLWELAFSGPMLNPARPGDFDEHGQDSKAAEQAAYDRAAASPMPPRARILIYSGYLLLTASAVLQIGTLRSPATGAPLQAFDSETIVRVGVAELGVPLAITLFLLSWLRKAQPARGDAGTAPAGKVPLSQQRDTDDRDRSTTAHAGPAAFDRTAHATAGQERRENAAPEIQAPRDERRTG
jgi:hypothetical protein